MNYRHWTWELDNTWYPWYRRFNLRFVVCFIFICFLPSLFKDVENSHKSRFLTFSIACFFFTFMTKIKHFYFKINYKKTILTPCKEILFQSYTYTTIHSDDMSNGLLLIRHYFSVLLFYNPFKMETGKVGQKHNKNEIVSPALYR